MRSEGRSPGPPQEVGLAAFSPDGKQLALARVRSDFQETELTVRDLVSGKDMRRWKAPVYLAISASPDGRTFAGFEVSNPVSGRFTLRLWDAATGAERQLPLPTRTRTFREDLLLARQTNAGPGNSDGTIYLWDMAGEQVRRQLEGHQSPVNCLTFSPEGKTLASGCVDTTALLWDVLPPGDGKQPSPARLRELWDVLAGDDAAKAFDAVATLVAFAEASVPFLKEQLQAVAKRPPAQTVTARHDEQLRTVRAVEVLEYAASPAARALLETLAAGRARRRSDARGEDDFGPIEIPPLKPIYLSPGSHYFGRCVDRETALWPMHRWPRSASTSAC